MNGSLLRGRLLVRIQSGSPKLPLNTGLCALFVYPLCKIMKDFAASVREYVKNTGTKPVQTNPFNLGCLKSYERKNLVATAITNEAQFRKALQRSINVLTLSPFRANLVVAT